ncbi:hypothetical protein N7493_009804 [Penicillium malachiteum]|uniref:Uncharacterized protein n=1 Tax=Penicillium malachiteum TaxID=1324776 RepID=A0AAD6MSL2_9EURO|nr:hypothetical protein N7493_009804 [Penicillium malachiteum]
MPSPESAVGSLPSDHSPTGSQSGILNGSGASDTGTNDTVGDGKQNSKAAVTTSGVSAEPSSDANGTPQSNGTNSSAHSRKRSRDRSTIQPSDVSGAMAVRTRETPVEKIILENYVNRQFEYAAATAWQNPSQELQPALFGPGYEGFGNTRTDMRNHPPQLLYPSNRRRPGSRKTRELRVSRRDMKVQSEQIEDLVPIRLDIDWEKVKIQ